jgi:hypothetical protein
MIEWRFLHPKTGFPCVARFDGAVLEVEPGDFDEPAIRGYLGNDLFDALDSDEDLDVEGDSAFYDLSDAGLIRTHCASEAAALRELRAIGVEARFLS